MKRVISVFMMLLFAVALGGAPRERAREVREPILRRVVKVIKKTFGIKKLDDCPPGETCAEMVGPPKP
jgi:hypothetical protein